MGLIVLDIIRDRIEEQKNTRNRKVLIGFIAIIFIALFAFLLEGAIGRKIEEITIDKATITEEKAIFIPVKHLDTQIIAVKATDGGYRLAFNDCIGCYYTSGKHGRYKNNSDYTGLICDTCKTEIMYDEMGFLPEEAMPYPIVESEIISELEKFVIPEEYLEEKQIVLENFRNGKMENNYSVNPDNK